MVVQLDVGVVLAIDLHQFHQRLARLLLVAETQPFIHRPGNAASQADDALRKLLQHLAVHPRLAVIQSLQMALGNEFAQVVPALVGLRQQGHVGRPLAADHLAFVLHRSRREVDFAAEDRLDPHFVAVLIEFDRPVEVAVVRHRHRRHPQILGALGQILGADHAVEQRKLGV